MPLPPSTLARVFDVGVLQPFVELLLVISIDRPTTGDAIYLLCL